MTLRLRFDDLEVRVTRSHTLARPTDDTTLVLAAVRGLLEQNWSLIAASGLSLVGVTLAGLDGAESLQPELPFGVPTRALDGAVDAVREKFGSGRGHPRGAARTRSRRRDADTAGLTRFTRSSRTSGSGQGRTGRRIRS